jgi:molecular chaperone HtpG
MTAAAAPEVHEFQAETTQILNLMIHSLYTQRDIFLRELISNASDALDRLRFEALIDPSIIAAGHTFEIRLKPDEKTRTLTISDTGIGMSRQELSTNLGTIAKSGTREVWEKLKLVTQEASAGLIGQFGVGFYSAFMVAYKVSVVTRRAGEQIATRWESTGDGVYTLSEAERASCGTDVILFLKQVDLDDGIDDYTDRWKLTNIVHRYSDLIAYPIIYEGPSHEPGTEAKETNDPAESPKILKTLNSMKPIWTRRRSEVRPIEYSEFYKEMFHSGHDPLRVLTLRAEGTEEYEALLYIPSQAPEDLFYHGLERGLRLYARRVLVMERCEDLLPRYLRFVKGVVDSSDLPLNISRQRLQQDRHIVRMRKWLTRKILEELTAMAEKELDQYLAFWGQFGQALKEGVDSDYENKDKLLPLLLFESSNHPTELTNLKSYVDRMKPEQTELLYLTGDSRKIIENSPHLEATAQRGYEVLYLKDPVDEILMRHLREFEGRKLKPLNKGNVHLGTEEEKREAEERLKVKQKEYSTFLEELARNLADNVRQVRLSTRLVGFPVCLVDEDHEYGPRLERLLQKGNGATKQSRRIMEVNADHPLIVQMYKRFVGERDKVLILDCGEVLFSMALLAEGSPIVDPVRFNELVMKLLEKAV